jgi:hypothetical protein
MFITIKKEDVNDDYWNYMIGKEYELNDYLDGPYGDQFNNETIIILTSAIKTLLK